MGRFYHIIKFLAFGLSAPCWLTYLFGLASYEDGQDLGEEAGQERVERRLVLEEAVQLHQQFLVFSQSVVDLAHVRGKQLTRYVGIPGGK